MFVNGFVPSGGQDFPVLSFAGSSGAFGTFTGLALNDFAVVASAMSLDLVAFMTAADLTATSVSPVQTTIAEGQSLTVDWQVGNASTNAAAGSWQDSVYLSPTAAVTSSSILLGSEMHSGGLAANGTYNGSLSAAVPPLPPGNYYVLVEVDSLDGVPDPNRANNLLAASEQVAISVPGLTLDSPLTDSFTAADQDRYYQISVPAGGALTVALASSVSSGAVALYVSEGVPPTPYNFQEGADVANQPKQTVLVPQVLTGGT
jgi:hypothetical protein